MKEFKSLRNRIERNHKRDLRAAINSFKSAEGLKNGLMRYGKRYKGSEDIQRIKLVKYVTKSKERDLNSQLLYISEIEQSGDFKGSFYITLDWKKSYTWGKNPISSTSAGYISPVVSGCGYCKASTATAYSLNSNKSLLKLLCSKKNNRINSKNHDLLGYGSGYGIIPRFEGSVGVNCHEDIISGLGLTMRRISSSKTSDVYEVSK